MTFAVRKRLERDEEECGAVFRPHPASQNIGIDHDGVGSNRSNTVVIERVFRKSGYRFYDQNKCKFLIESIFSTLTGFHLAGKCSKNNVLSFTSDSIRSENCSSAWIAG
ncbi:hypothetical protein [Nitrobacter winogradskyi]|uniref:hypothetical protein n=1 Tax=Nitrobacter winogradskyi TaxID=913 RepID=UPI001AED8D1E|nr:hypothetical protein [Nitrobacter winogradskyi]